MADLIPFHLERIGGEVEPPGRLLASEPETHVTTERGIDVAGGYGARTGELSGVAETVLGHADPIGELADRAADAEVREGDLGAAFAGVPSTYHAAVRRGVAEVLRRHSAATATLGGKLADASGRYTADDESAVRTVGEVDL